MVNLIFYYKLKESFCVKHSAWGDFKKKIYLRKNLKFFEKRTIPNKSQKVVKMCKSLPRYEQSCLIEACYLAYLKTFFMQNTSLCTLYSERVGRIFKKLPKNLSQNFSLFESSLLYYREPNYIDVKSQLEQ